MSTRYWAAVVLLLLGVASAGTTRGADVSHIQDAPIQWTIIAPEALADLQGTADSATDAQRDAVRAAERRGYLNARVEHVDATSDRHQIVLDAGALAVIGDVRFSDGSDLRDPIVAAQLQRLNGMPFDADQVAAVFHEAVTDLARTGFPLSRIEIASADFLADSPHVIQLTLHVEQGEQVNLSSIEITGSERVSPRLVEHLIGQRRGRPIVSYDPASISEALIRSGFVRDVQVQRLRSDAAGVVLGLHIDDTPPGYFDVAIGYLPEGPRSGFVGSGHLELINPFGGGRNVSMRLDRIAGQASRFDFRASDPYVFGSSVSLAVEFAGLQQDSLYNRFAYAAEPGIRLAPGLMIYGTLSREAVRPGVAGARIIGQTQRIARSDQTMLGAGIQFQSLDTPINPSRGLFVDLRAERGTSSRAMTRRIDGEDRYEHRSLPIQRLSARSDLYLPVRARQVLHLGLDANALVVDELDRASLFRIGGARSLRGYDEDMFLARTAMIGTIEARHRMDRVSFLYVFADVAYLERPELAEIDALEGVRAGYGLGAHFDAGFGLLNLSLAFNPDDGPQSPRIHAGVAFGL